MGFMSGYHRLDTGLGLHSGFLCTANGGYGVGEETQDVALRPVADSRVRNVLDDISNA